VRDDDQIAKLETLLARIRSRSHAPGSKPVFLPSVEDDPFDPPPTPLSVFRSSPLPPPPPPSRPKHTPRPAVPSGLFMMGSPESSRVRQIDPPPSISQPRTPPPAPISQPAIAPPPPPISQPKIAPAPPISQPKIAASTPMDIVELDVEPDPTFPPSPVSNLEAPFSGPVEAALESRSRLVSAVPQSPDPLEPHAPSDPSIEVAAAEVSNAELEELEDERPPSSSRRPISMESQLDELDNEWKTAPGGDSFSYSWRPPTEEAPSPGDVVPLHAPPPASGKLPAAAPAIELEAVQPELPAPTDVALFIPDPRPPLAESTFGAILDDALSL
jgi:hypothetical protein